MPGARSFAPGICIGVESALDQGDVDQIFREAVGLEDIFHQRDIFPGPGEPSRKSLSSGGLKTFDEQLHSGINDDGNIKIGLLFSAVLEKGLQVEIVPFLKMKKLQSLLTLFFHC